MADFIEIVTDTTNVIEVGGVFEEITTTITEVITIDGVGAPGPKGRGVPVGGTAGQVLAKIDGSNYNTEWVDDSDTVTWIDVAGDVEYTGAETTIASGDVLTADYKGGTVYRFINSTENANGYPSEDSFYSDFDGTNLTNLIVTRG
tara:strand:+ start:173 stop:610 length:438 start_codon:yes stop_codon:yes gene_type:complete